MPELPDLTIYIEAMAERISDKMLLGIRISNPFILRSVNPSVAEICTHRVTGFDLSGKQIIIKLENGYFILIHLMIAGRLQWYKSGAKIPAKRGLIAFDFETGTLILTEAGQKRRASVNLVQGDEALRDFDRGGLRLVDADLGSFIEALSKENHTLKRSLTDQRFLSGVGNAYSDEILHRARISPMRQIRHLTDEQWLSLFNSTIAVMEEWTDKLREKAAGTFPKKVTAFHDEMAVHGKYKTPCPDCGNPVQRIRYATNECNYCAACQTQGNLLADRSLSRLLKKDWPKTLEELD